MRSCFVSALFLSCADAFIPGSTRPRLTSDFAIREQSTVLFAAKKKGGAAANAKLAALEALDALGDDLNQPVSNKEQKALEKQKQREQAAAENDKAEVEEPAKKMSKKEENMKKALELDRLDAEREAAQGGTQSDDESKLSKKELKALQKKEEKMASKAAAKAEKKANKGAELEVAVPETTVEEYAQVEAKKQETKNLTLEDKVRKNRPPPRIRVMEGTQPGFVSLRLENVGITFRNQEVLKDVTWGVQAGDRIGLVGRNGAGKTTQLRILAGELEPTTGDVVKSSGDLRTAMLRQEFVDELVKDRTLKEEFTSVFIEENQILQDLKETEDALENMGSDDADTMQEILDRMQQLQQKAEDKDVYLLESRVKKIMDLMGFTDDEGDDLVASFSGGWKMRIGLGKVLLKDPNVLLLGEKHVPLPVFARR
jgi:ABC-type Mn2+/Zn2+ transport system ATPase subunit